MSRVDLNGEIPSQPPGVRLTALENGLTIIICENHSAPVVSAQLWCQSGSIHEGKWLGAGLSHFLEHMLFKGTTTRPSSRIDQEVQEAGGYMNAYTSFDRTVYWVNVPNTGAKVALDVLCDISQNATLPPAEMEKEKQVILREMDMNHDDPSRRSSRRLFETAYTRSPYRYSIIGHPDLFTQLQWEDVYACYREHYVPNNLFFVVAGDLHPDTIIDQIRQALVPAKTKPFPQFVLPQEPKQTAPREVIEEATIELAHLHLSWHIPDLRHPDLPALDVLSTIIGGGRSSRLYQKVRETGLVSSINSWIYNSGHPGLFGISAITNASQFSQARAAILEQVEQLKTQPLPPEELAKAAKQASAATLSARKTMQGQAQDLGDNWIAANDLNFSERFLKAIQRLIPQDLARVAQRYFASDNRTLYALLPAGAARPLVASIEPARDQPIQLTELPNGLRLLTKADHRLPFVQFRALLRGGVLAESIANNGLTQILAKMLLTGTTTRSGEQIATEFESIGGNINTYGGNNSFGASAEVLQSDFPIGLKVLADLLLNPRFASADLERERSAQLAAIKIQKDQLLPSAMRLMRLTMFGETGYGLDALGTESSVQKIQTSDLRQFHQSLMAPNNCVLAIYGDIQTSEVEKAVASAFAHWKPSPLPSAESTARPSLSQTLRLTEKRDKKQAVLLIGFRGTTLQHPDRYPLELLEEACSDLGSRLSTRIREQLGLAYYVGAQNLLGLTPGFFAFYVGTAPEKVALVEVEILRQAERLRTEGLTAAELQRAKAKLIGQRKIARQDLGNLAMNTALDELYGLGYAACALEETKYNAVTLDDVKAAAQAYLDPTAAVIAVIAP